MAITVIACDCSYCTHRKVCKYVDEFDQLKDKAEDLITNKEMFTHETLCRQFDRDTTIRNCP